MNLSSRATVKITPVCFFCIYAMPSILNSWWNLPDIIKHIVASSAWPGRKGTKINETNLTESVELIAIETEREIRSKLAFDYLVTNTDKSMCTLVSFAADFRDVTQRSPSVA